MGTIKQPAVVPDRTLTEILRLHLWQCGYKKAAGLGAAWWGWASLTLARR